MSRVGSTGSETPPKSETRKLDENLVGGVAWTAAAKWITQLVSWPSVVIAARMLTVADFGAVDLAGYYIVLTTTLAEFGIGSAVLQMRELERRVLMQLNSVSFLFGLAFSGVSVAVAPFVAEFFHTPILNRLLMVASLSFILTGLQAVPMGMLQRDMDYRKLSLAEGGQALVQATMTIFGALTGRGYWSLILAVLFGRVFSAVLTQVWKPIGFARPHWKDIASPMRFGLAVAFSRAGWTFYQQSDGVVVGRVLGQTVVGGYRMAIDMAGAPATKIGMLLMRVTGPLFARIQHDQELTRRYFLQISESLALLLLPMATGIAVVAPDAVRVVLGPQWSGVVAPLRWLALFSVIQLLSSLSGQVLLSLRFTRFAAKMTVVTALTMPPAFYFASRWGSGAVAATWLVMVPITVLPGFAKLFRSIRCGFWQYTKVLMPAAAASAVMVAGVMIFRARPQPEHWRPLVRLAAEIGIGGVLYLGALWIGYEEQVLKYVRFFVELYKGRGNSIGTE